MHSVHRVGTRYRIDTKIQHVTLRKHLHSSFSFRHHFNRQHLTSSLIFFAYLNGYECAMSVSSGERNVATFIARIEERTDNDTSLPAFVRHYRKAQLLTAQGLFQDSLPCLQEAMDTIRPHRTDFLWERTYVAIGGLLANTLDYFGQYDDSEAIYNELLLSNVNGEYISGYAIFLHKRKKDFDEAQR